MTCMHLREIDRVCNSNGIVLGRTDLIRIVCAECGEHEVCPAHSVTLTEDANPVARVSVVGKSMNTHGLGLPESVEPAKEAG